MNWKTIQWRSLNTRVTIFTLIIFVVSIWSLAFYATRTLRTDMERQLGEQQFSTVSVVATDINWELDDRLRALQAVASGVRPTLLGKPVALQILLDERPALLQMFNGGVIAYRLDGTAIAEIPREAGRVGTNYMDIDTVATALRDGKSSIGRPVMGKKLNAPVFGMTAPIRDAQGTVIGALAGVVNLGMPNFLDKITGNTYGKTGGYLLVAPQHKLVITGTDKSRIMTATPAPGLVPLIDRFMQGYEGSGIFINPVGVEVLGSAKNVPVAGWQVVAQLPTAEAFAPIHAMQQRIAITAFVLTVLSGLLTWWMLRRQLAPLLAASKLLVTLSATNQPPQPLPITRQDEIGDLIGGFNRLLETLAQRAETLRQSEVRFRDITFSIADWVWEVDENGVYTYSSQKGFDFFGPLREAVIGKTPFDFMPPDEARRVAAIFSEIAANRAPIKDLENWNIDKSGQNICLLTNGVPIFDKAGNFKGYRGVDRDITERKEATEKLEARDAYLTAIIENQSGLIWLKDVKGRFLAINHAFAASCGREMQDVLGKTDLDIWPREMAEKYIADDAKVIQAGRPIAVEELIQDENEPKWFETFKTPIRDSHGNIIGSTGYARDITERKAAEQALQQSLKNQTALLMEVHHRVKNNLQVISSLLRMEAGRSNVADTKAVLTDMQGRIRSMALLHKSLYRSGTFASVDLGSYLQEVTTQAFSSQSKHPDLVQLTLNLGSVLVGMDQAISAGLLVNELISNCLKHGFPQERRGEVSVVLQPVDAETQTDAALWRLCVSDTGVGLAPDFEERSKASLGMQLANDLSQQVGGDLAIHSKPGQGAKFTVIFTALAPEALVMPV
jgi:PAS domain S-box-containing protein